MLHPVIYIYMCFSVIWSSCVEGSLPTGCHTHAEINLNNNLLCLSLVLFPIPHLYAFLLTHGQPHPPTCHPVNLCCPALSGPPTSCVCDLAAVMDLSMSDLFSILFLLCISWDTYTPPSSLIIGSPYILRAATKIYTETWSECTWRCMWAFIDVQACMHGHVWLWWQGKVPQETVSSQFVSILSLSRFSLWSVKNLPSTFLCFLSLLVPKALRTSSSGSIEPFKTGIFSGRVPYTAAAFAPGLRKSPHGGVPSLTTSSSQAKALLASLSASGLTTEALLLSSTLRYHRLLREQRAPSVPLPSSQSSSPTPPASSSSSCSSSPTTLTPSLSPSSPCPLNALTYSSAFVNGSACCLDSSVLNHIKDSGNEAGNRDLTHDHPQWRWWEYVRIQAPFHHESQKKKKNSLILFHSWLLSFSYS